MLHILAILTSPVIHPRDPELITINLELHHKRPVKDIEYIILSSNEIIKSYDLFPYKLAIRGKQLLLKNNQESIEKSSDTNSKTELDGERGENMKHLEKEKLKLFANSLKNQFTISKPTITFYLLILIDDYSYLKGVSYNNCIEEQQPCCGILHFSKKDSLNFKVKILLHEIGHLLGAEHDLGDGFLMSETGDENSKETGLSNESREAVINTLIHYSMDINGSLTY